MENICAVRWNWPFKTCNGNGNHHNGADRNGGELNGFAGHACPDFLCVGAQKAGTTWLYRELESHPDFWMPPLKELHYFDQLSRVPRSSSTLCRDERDLRFLESIKSLSAKPYLDLAHYGRLFEPKGP